MPNKKAHLFLNFSISQYFWLFSDSVFLYVIWLAGCFLFVREEVKLIQIKRIRRKTHGEHGKKVKTICVETDIKRYTIFNGTKLLNFLFTQTHWFAIFYWFDKNCSLNNLFVFADDIQNAISIRFDFFFAMVFVLFGVILFQARSIFLINALPHTWHNPCQKINFNLSCLEWAKNLKFRDEFSLNKNMERCLAVHLLTKTLHKTPN